MPDQTNIGVAHAEHETTAVSEPIMHTAHPPRTPLIVVPSLVLIAATFLGQDPLSQLLETLGGSEGTPRRGRW